MHSNEQRTARGNIIAVTLCFVLLSIAVSNVAKKALDPGSAFKPNTAWTTPAEKKPERLNYDALRRSITYGQATLFDVRQALTQRDEMGLSNTIHALYGMRIQRGVIHILRGIWDNNRQAYPEFTWELLNKPSVRIAVASTLNRIQIVNSDEYKEYIRDHRHSGQSFIRAQASIALGLGGDPEDLEYLFEQADGYDHYVAQSAITALSLYGGNRARDLMIKLLKKHQGTARGGLIAELLRKAYDWPPEGLHPLS